MIIVQVRNQQKAKLSVTILGVQSTENLALVG